MNEHNRRWTFAFCQHAFGSQTTPGPVVMAHDHHNPTRWYKFAFLIDGRLRVWKKYRPWAERNGVLEEWADHGTQDLKAEDA